MIAKITRMNLYPGNFFVIIKARVSYKNQGLKIQSKKKYEVKAKNWIR